MFLVIYYKTRLTRLVKDNLTVGLPAALREVTQLPSFLGQGATLFGLAPDCDRQDGGPDKPKTLALVRQRVDFS